ncbi:MAG: lipid A biosynthesis lauroyl acyltransferase [Rickettsiales bacterium]|nr:lipid A biosynthesis lauroyl acyltransferase [Rickettsiales bacterium]
MIRTIRYGIELLALRLFFLLLRLLPLDVASWLGGKVIGIIGPLSSAHRTAVRNLQRIMPDTAPDEKSRILSGMWDNLGRVMAEMAHIANDALMTRVTCLGNETFTEHKDKPVLFFSGHLGNWELLPYTAESRGVPLALAYRSANNPLVDRFICSLRAKRVTTMFPKGPTGSVRLLRALKNQHSLAMLVDQKMNDGIPVPFFGIDAMTAPAIAQLALRHDLPIIPTRVIRKKGVAFDAIIYPALTIEKTGDNQKDTLAIMTQINAILESWVREYPEQWFWVHNRWPAS